MAAGYTVTTGKVVSPSNLSKVAVQLATASGVTSTVTGFDVGFDGTTGTATPLVVELVRTSGASSGGTTATLQQEYGKTRTAQTTARINDTTDGASPTVIRSWPINPTTSFSYQWPLGRCPELDGSSYLEFRITTVAGSGTPNYWLTAAVEE